MEALIFTWVSMVTTQSLLSRYQFDGGPEDDAPYPYQGVDDPRVSIAPKLDGRKRDAFKTVNLRPGQVRPRQEVVATPLPNKSDSLHGYRKSVGFSLEVFLEIFFSLGETKKSVRFALEVQLEVSSLRELSE
jgi:hypothetical protein